MKHKISFRTIENKDYPFILSLNEKNVEVLAPMDEAKLSYFKENSAFVKVAEADGKAAAFIIVFREGADYQSENYKWFSKHYSKFLYVDRIVIDEPYRSIGLGRKMYQYVFDYASRTGVQVVTAEIDIEPVYNEASLNFHAAMGFEEVGKQYVRNGEIKVSLQKANVTSPEQSVDS